MHCCAALQCLSCVYLLHDDGPTQILVWPQDEATSALDSITEKRIQVGRWVQVAFVQADMCMLTCTVGLPLLATHASRLAASILLLPVLNQPLLQASLAEARSDRTVVIVAHR